MDLELLVFLLGTAWFRGCLVPFPSLYISYLDVKLIWIKALV